MGLSLMRTLLVHHPAEHEYLREHVRARVPEADEATLRDKPEGLSIPQLMAYFQRDNLNCFKLELKRIP